MRKLQRSVLRHQAYRCHAGIQGFHYLWKALRVKQGKWKFKSERLNKQQSKAKIIKTGNKMVKKPSIWKRLVSFLKNVLRIGK